MGHGGPVSSGSREASSTSPRLDPPRTNHRACLTVFCAPLIERQTVEQMRASARSSAQDALRLRPNEERRIIHQGLTDHYRRTLDLPIPSLGNSRRARRRRQGRSGEGDRLVEDAGEPFRTARAGRSGRQLRFHLDLEGTWPRRRVAMNRSSDLHRAFEGAPV
jgi:hypothetical protein